MALDVIGKCWSCSGELTASDYGRETLCLGCSKATRVCKNCQWYDTGRTHQCAEAILEPVKEKERANYCEFFVATADTSDGNSVGGVDPLQAAEDLFK